MCICLVCYQFDTDAQKSSKINFFKLHACGKEIHKYHEGCFLKPQMLQSNQQMLTCCSLTTNKLTCCIVLLRRAKIMVLLLYVWLQLTTPKLRELISRDCVLGISIFLFVCSPPVSEGLRTTIGFDRSSSDGWDISSLKIYIGFVT
jgi:hypothetical protein